MAWRIVAYVAVVVVVAVVVATTLASRRRRRTTRVERAVARLRAKGHRAAICARCGGAGRMDDRQVCDVCHGLGYLHDLPDREVFKD